MTNTINDIDFAIRTITTAITYDRRAWEGGRFHDWRITRAQIAARVERLMGAETLMGPLSATDAIIRWCELRRLLKD